MPRSYRHISEYEKEIIDRFNKGQSSREIAEELGFNFKYRYNKNKRLMEAGQVIHKKGRPCKNQYSSWISLHNWDM